ncbi:dynamin family protein [Ornithinibacillus californiensis]|uniref:dynamin family protein n=1 Tax=Ornithinibacillus californiensis TaxID=161536 RepID=UPI00069DD3E8|nr:dynamin family protein [Ornithinibacillus californiensis]
MKAIEQNTSIIDYDTLTGLYHVLLEHGDEVNAIKIIDLYKKKYEEEFVISFAGHFSAGKSSMINALIGKELLPKSPIPTSANIVKLSSGDGVARVFFHSEDPIEYDEPYNLDMIKEYCRDKDLIKKIEISSSEPIIPNGCSLIDTPGIDAADDTDRLITESSLHLVDVLFYVMDYNHVQSEVNLMFLKKIQSMNIPFYIIINQIDKHNENELSFQSFENSVKQTFEQWGLSPKAVYFSSLLNKDVSYNQFDDIKNKIHRLFHEERILRIESSLNTVMDAHRHFLEERHEEKLARLSNIDTTDENTLEKITLIRNNIKDTKQKAQHFENDFIDDLNQTLKNAYLMPAAIRDKALKFLESQQKDFRVGFIGAKKKTEEEKTNRLHDFLTSVQESMKASIEWKLREKLAELVNRYSIRDTGIDASIQQLTITFDQNDLQEHIKKGAKVNGDSVLHYTNDLGHAIKTKYRNAARLVLSRIIDVIEQESKEKIAHNEAELINLQDQLEVHEQYLAIKAESQDQLQRLNKQIHTPDYTNATESLIKEKLKRIEFNKGKTIASQQMNNIVPYIEENTEHEPIKEDTPEAQRVIHAIDKTVQLVQDLPAFNSLVSELLTRKEKLQNRELTIALFGAFSAGKSSFANALIGEGILPSSPNPTTAVINRITPVTEEHSHGTVAIHLKDQDTIRQDLINILKPFSPPEFTDIGDLIDWIIQNNTQYHEELNHMYQSYLQAIIKGYDAHKSVIGKSITIQLNDFEAYVTDETKACFVEAIDLYYDCSITQKGITLVDTPGADSVNARHTNVAFDYIKNADAILYVTYYNHAVTKADKDFVMQLGRVKDSFQLDKMFFIINAADLAQDQTELNLVNNYVRDQLARLGIRNPRLYALSSKKSLAEKLAKEQINEQLHAFEEEFYAFLENELSQLAIKSSIHELGRTKQLLDHVIQKASLNEQEKQNYKQELLKREQHLLQVVDREEGKVYKDRINQKVTKQLHYVVERIGIRFHDMFKDKFNPTTITESGRKANYQLEKNMFGLLDYVGYELLQEARAVSLRIEAYAKEQYTQMMEDYTQSLLHIDQDFSLPAVKNVELDTPNYIQPLQSIDLDRFQTAFSLFKGTKSFFVNKEKEKMKDVLYQILLPEIQSFIAEAEQTMSEAYSLQWEAVIQNTKQDLQNEINQYVNSSLKVLEDKIDISVLNTKASNLVKLLETI